MPNSTKPSQGVTDATAIAKAAADVGTMAARTIATINDEKKRASFSQSLDLLSLDQQNALEKSLQNANSNIERLRIITDTLTNLSAKRIDLLAQANSTSEVNIRKNTYIAAGAFVVVAIGIIVLIYKKD
jgi:hypothetical protein